VPLRIACPVLSLVDAADYGRPIGRRRWQRLLHQLQGERRQATGINEARWPGEQKGLDEQECWGRGADAADGRSDASLRCVLAFR